MKKIFTLICMAAMAVSVNAQDETPQGDPGIYPLKSITMGDITWKNGNNKTDINDEAGTKLYFVMGQGNAYKEIFAEYYQSSNDGLYYTRAFYTYVYYWQQGITGVPSYGLFYKFTPKVSGKLKVLVWANKGNRATTIVPASTGTPLVMHTDYQVEGYINGKTKNTTTPVIDSETNQQKVDNDGNPVWVQEAILYDNNGIKELHDAATNPWAALTEPDKDGNMPDKWNYVIGPGNQHFWGWLTFDVTAGESYYVFQASSQMGFGGYDFTPTGGTTESYQAALDMGGTIALNTEFSSKVDAEGKATNVENGNSVIKISTANMDVEAVGSGTPTAVEADFTSAGISAVKAELNADAPMYNLAGQKVDKDYKGIMIQNGKKFMAK